MVCVLMKLKHYVEDVNLPPFVKDGVMKLWRYGMEIQSKLIKSNVKQHIWQCKYKRCDLYLVNIPQDSIDNNCAFCGFVMRIVK